MNKDQIKGRLIKRKESQKSCRQIDRQQKTETKGAGEKTAGKVETYGDAKEDLQKDE